MMHQAKNKQELFSWINKVSFMAYDMALYLDTHPDDTQAMEFFHKYSQMRRQALANYAAQFGPLTMDCISNDDHWHWATQPWPWEGGYC